MLLRIYHIGLGEGGRQVYLSLLGDDATCNMSVEAGESKCESFQKIQSGVNKHNSFFYVMICDGDDGLINPCCNTIIVIIFFLFRFLQVPSPSARSYRRR